MSKLDDNIDLARRCIDYVNGLNVKSVNVPFRRGTYYKYSKYHSFVLDATRCETFNVPDEVLRRRRQVLTLLADTSKTKQHRRAAVKALMNQWGVAYFDNYTPRGFFRNVTRNKDEERIRLCRRAVKTRHGNCGEKSALCATWLLENRPGNENILWVCGNPAYDHAWVVFDHPDPNWNGVIDQLSGDAVVVDGWTGDYYQAKHPTRYWHGGAANPFQITVRHNILNASGNIRVKENVRQRDWTTSFSPRFKLAYADRPPSAYEPPNAYLLRAYGKDDLKDARDNDGWDQARSIQGALDDLADADADDLQRVDDLELADD
jgi:hypothetical protein